MLRPLVLLMLAVLCGCTTPQFMNESPAPQQGSDSQSLSDQPEFWKNSPSVIWDKVKRSPTNKLKSALNQTSDQTATGWIKLALISKQYSISSQMLSQQLMQWRKEYPNHPGNALFPDDSTLTALQNTPTPKKIVLLLPLNGSLSAQGQAVRDGFLNAYYESAQKSQQNVSFIDTNRNLNVSAYYQQALAQGADTIVGPLTKEQVAALVKQGNFTAPTIALNYTDIGFGSLPTNFYEFGLSTQDEAGQMADKAWQMGRSRALVIAPQNEWGQRVTKPLISRFESLGGHITDSYYYTPSSNLSEGIAALLHIDTKEDQKKMHDENNKQTLEQQRRQDFDVIFIVAQPQVARQIVPMLKFYYVTKIPMIASSSVYTGTPDPQKDSDLDGVYFCDIPWVLKSHHSSDQQVNRLYAVGIDSYTVSNNIPRLNQLPNFPIYGTTGALTLTSKHQIYRRLPWVQMHAGYPQ